jgi:hypothetical protein
MSHPRYAGVMAQSSIEVGLPKIGGYFSGVVGRTAGELRLWLPTRRRFISLISPRHSIADPSTAPCLIRIAAVVSRTLGRAGDCALIGHPWP